MGSYTPRVRTGRRLLLASAALLLALSPFLALEAHLRLRDRPAAPGEPLSIPTVEDDVLGWRLRPGSYPAHRLTVNALGLRGPEVAPAKAPGAIRVVAAGNSCVQGVGVGDTETFCAVLDGLLDDAEVLNAGVGGYNSNQIRLFVPRVVLPLEPDVVVLYMGWNDLVTATWPGWSPNLHLGPRAPTPPAPPSLIARLLGASRAFRAIQVRARDWGIRHTAPNGGVDVVNGRAIENFRANLEATVDGLLESGVGVVLCRLPYDAARAPRRYGLETYAYTPEGFRSLWGRFDSVIREVASARGLPVADLPAAVASLGPAAFLDYNHLSPAGHAAVAAALVRPVGQERRARAARTSP